MCQSLLLIVPFLTDINELTPPIEFPSRPMLLALRQRLGIDEEAETAALLYA